MSIFHYCCLFTLCTATVNAFQIVFSDSSYERTAKWENCHIFQRGQIVGVRLAVASLTKMATITCTQNTSFQGFDGIHKPREDIIS
jgi:hypothetical protein